MSEFEFVSEYKYPRTVLRLKVKISKDVKLYFEHHTTISIDNVILFKHFLEKGRFVFKLAKQF